MRQRKQISQHGHRYGSLIWTYFVDRYKVAGDIKDEAWTLSRDIMSPAYTWEIRLRVEQALYEKT